MPTYPENALGVQFFDVVFLPARLVTADQPQKSLRMHFMAVRTHGALLRHWPTIGGRRFALLRFGWRRAQIRRPPA